MAKRKKIKKAGSTTRNIHKIATTLGVIPMVASSFLFADGYALATSTLVARPTQTILIDLSDGRYDYDVSEFFTASSSSIYLTGAITSDVTNGVLSVSQSVNAVYLRPHTSQGTALVTIHATTYNYDDVETKFNVSFFDPAIVSQTLDVNHDGLDVGDIINSTLPNSTTAKAADLNGNGVVDKEDLTKLLEFIPHSFTNHNPIITKTITNKSFIQGHSLSTINLDSYFSDPDGDYLDYRVYASGASVSGNIVGQYLNFNINDIGTTSFTVVAHDDEDGSKIMNFSATVYPTSGLGARSNTAPTIVWDPSTELAIAQNLPFDMEQMFTDADFDSLSYSLTTPSFFNGVFASNELYIYSCGDTATYPLTISATDNHSSASVAQTIYVQMLSDKFNVNMPTSLDLSTFLTGTTGSPTIVSANSQYGTSILTTNSGGTYLNITGISQGTYTVTISAPTATTPKKKTFIVPINWGEG